MNTRVLMIVIALLVFASYTSISLAADSTGTTGQTDTEAGDPAADPESEEPADPGLDGDSEQPSYSNPAQAKHAANLAEQAALQPNPQTEEAAEALDTARESYHDAKQALAESPDDPDLQQQLEIAEEDLVAARGDYADAIGELSGVLGEDVQQMRQNGMGWGQIAHELGVHPGVLGLGHGKKKGGLDPVDGVDDLAYGPDAEVDPQQEIAEATRRDKQSGWSKAHGLSTSGEKSSKKGLGLSKTSSAEGVSKSPGSKSANSKSSANSKNSSSSKSAGTSGSSRGNDGGPSGSSNNSGGNSKSKDKSSKSNNGKGKGNDK